MSRAIITAVTVARLSCASNADWLERVVHSLNWFRRLSCELYFCVLTSAWCVFARLWSHQALVTTWTTTCTTTTDVWCVPLENTEPQMMSHSSHYVTVVIWKSKINFIKKLGVFSRFALSLQAQDSDFEGAFLMTQPEGNWEILTPKDNGTYHKAWINKRHHWPSLCFYIRSTMRFVFQCVCACVCVSMHACANRTWKVHREYRKVQAFTLVCWLPDPPNLIGHCSSMQLLHQRQEVPFKATENMPTGDVMVSWPHVCAYACVWVWERKSARSVVTLLVGSSFWFITKCLAVFVCPQSEF